MIVKVPLMRKAPELETKDCFIAAVVELERQEFRYFKKHLLEEYDFIANHAQEMKCGPDGVHHCLLVLGEGENDGILVDSEGANYARYSASFPYARDAIFLYDNPVMKDHLQEMVELTEKIKKQALACQQDGRYRIHLPDWDVGENDVKAQSLIAEMLSDSPEFMFVENWDSELVLHIAPEFVVAEDDSHLRVLDEDDVYVMCAQHVLWSRDRGGECADFSNCLIKDIDLRNMALNGAILKGAKFERCRMNDVGLCFADCSGAKFHDCELEGAVAENAKFPGSKFVNSSLNKAIFTWSDFYEAQLENCTVHQAIFHGCCMGKMIDGGIDYSGTNLNNISEDHDAWMPESGLYAQM